MCTACGLMFVSPVSWHCFKGEKAIFCNAWLKYIRPTVNNLPHWNLFLMIAYDYMLFWVYIKLHLLLTLAMQGFNFCSSVLSIFFIIFLHPLEILPQVYSLLVYSLYSLLFPFCKAHMLVCLHFSPVLLCCNIPLLYRFFLQFLLFPLFCSLFFKPYLSSLPFSLVILSSILSFPFVFLCFSHLFLSSSSLCVHNCAPNPALPLPILSTLYILSLFPTL